MSSQFICHQAVQIQEPGWRVLKHLTLLWAGDGDRVGLQGVLVFYSKNCMIWYYVAGLRTSCHSTGGCSTLRIMMIRSRFFRLCVSSIFRERHILFEFSWMKFVNSTRRVLFELSCGFNLSFYFASEAVNLVVWERKLAIHHLYVRLSLLKYNLHTVHVNTSL